MNRFEFPDWVNRFVPLAVIGVGVVLAYLGAVLFAATDPWTMNVGYRPTQPVPFSHKLHAGTLKMDCRYCHNTVDVAAHAAIPPTSTCVNCHSGAKDATGAVLKSSVRTDSPALAPVRESELTGKSIPWTRVHDLPEFVYFDHSAHVNRGVSCVSCHGRVDKMEVVEQVMPLSMKWCLDCHRNPDPHLRPLDKVTQLDWVPDEAPEVIGGRIRDELHINPSTNCSTCHR